MARGSSSISLLSGLTLEMPVSRRTIAKTHENSYISIMNMHRVTVSDKAANQISKIISSEASPKMLRVSVSGGGCSGFQYGFDLVDEREEGDLAIEKGGITVLIDEISLAYLEGSEIDYVEDLIGASFQVHNPNAKSSCGCGTSFSI